MIKVVVVGVSGYIGGELVRFLVMYFEVEIMVIILRCFVG